MNWFPNCSIRCQNFSLRRIKLPHEEAPMIFTITESRIESWSWSLKKKWDRIVSPVFGRKKECFRTKSAAPPYLPGTRCELNSSWNICQLLMNLIINDRFKGRVSEEPCTFPAAKVGGKKTPQNLFLSPKMQSCICASGDVLRCKFCQT